MNLARKLAPLATLLTMVAGCAAETDSETESTNDELRSLASAEVVGDLREDMEALATTSRADGNYRAFKFDATKGSEHVAYVVTTSEVDPIAYILDANHRMLKRNDDRGASVRDAQIRFTAPRTGTYYLAFRTKERKAASVMARLRSASPDDPRETGTFADGWPVHSPYFGQADRTEFDVQVSATGTVITNYDGCPAAPFVEGRGSTLPTELHVKVDLKNGTASMSTGLVGESVPIAADGTFEIEKVDNAWGTIRGRGRVAAGGFVILDAGEQVSCSSNYAGNKVYNATQLANGLGATDTN